MHHLTLDRWSQGSSVWHARDARAKAIATLVFLLALATTPPRAAAAIVVYALLLIAGIASARLPLFKMLLRAAAVLPFSAAFGIASWLAGDTVGAAALVEKSYLSALAVLLLAATTPLPALLAGLEWLHVPRLLVLVIQFLYRYLFVISEQAQHMRLAAACRRGAARASRKTTWTAATGALAVLFARSYGRGEGTHRAMLSRGFEGRFHPLHLTRFRWPDTAFLITVCAAILCVRAAAPLMPAIVAHTLGVPCERKPTLEEHV